MRHFKRLTAGRRAFPIPICSLTSPIARNFSISTRLQVYFPPPFDPTPSPELDQLLDTIRHKILLPRHLDSSQRKLVQRAENHAYLAKEDVRVAIGGQEMRLVPFNFSTDGVSVGQSLNQALVLSESTGDFSFWSNLLKGARSAKLLVAQSLRERLAFTAAKKQQLPIVMQLLENAEKTSYPITPRLLIKLFTFCRDSAIFGADALRLAERDTSNDFTKESIQSMVEEADNQVSVVADRPELAPYRAKALKEGLRLSNAFNLLVTQPFHQKALREKDVWKSGLLSDPLDDPLLLALPLELQSRLEQDSSILEMSQTSNEVVSGSENNAPPRPSPSASEVATKMDLALVKRPIQAPDLGAVDPSEIRGRCSNFPNYAYLILSSLQRAQKVIDDAELRSRLQIHEQAVHEALGTFYRSVPSTHEKIVARPMWDDIVEKGGDLDFPLQYKFRTLQRQHKVYNYGKEQGEPSS
ncbi:hypothetical protein BT63DRAFT_451886 [Microthyrium microscopicum]|uniref:Uncharacterized protein n=1 Tax=Microthyrium microscopicum TaxID=703497 RepID=A0A6A6UQW7_9PEZI|nr:hypothetical protein BT63DRAFT_451886 [Microthyrium microscopicum]